MSKQQEGKGVIGKHAVYRKVCSGSSLDWAKEFLGLVDEGTLFVADRYEFARGRQGREWKLYPGQLILTFILTPDYHESLVFLNMALSVAVAAVLARYGVAIKWPNDFVWSKENIYKKVGGILLEAVWSGSVLRGVVVGIAVNGNNDFLPNNLLFHTATSLKALAGEDLNLDQLQKELLSSLNAWYTLWQNEKFDEIFAKWKAMQLSLGKKIVVHAHDASVVRGVVEEMKENGDLVVCDDGGKRQVISFCTVCETSLE